MGRECYGLMCLLVQLSDNDYDDVDDDDDDDDDIDDDNSLLVSQTERVDHNPFTIMYQWAKKGIT